MHPDAKQWHLDNDSASLEMMLEELVLMARGGEQGYPPLVGDPKVASLMARILAKFGPPEEEPSEEYSGQKGIESGAGWKGRMGQT